MEKNKEDGSGRLGRFLSERKRKKLTKREVELKRVIQELLEKGEVDPLFLDFVRSIEEEEQKIAWETILSRQDLEPPDLYKIIIVIPDGFGAIRERFFERFLREADEEELCDVIEQGFEDFNVRAFEELCRRVEGISNGLIKKGRAVKLLLRILKSSIRGRREELAQKALKLLVTLNPPADELRAISLLSPLDSMPNLEKAIDRFIGKKSRGDLNPKQLVRRIQALKEKIAEIKKSLGPQEGQEG